VSIDTVANDVAEVVALASAVLGSPAPAAPPPRALYEPPVRRPNRFNLIWILIDMLMRVFSVLVHERYVRVFVFAFVCEISDL
jgi:hypothetical protein